MKSTLATEKSNTYLLDNYGRLPITMVRGLGSEIWDIDNKRYIDFFSGFGGCGITGHCDPRITEVIHSQSIKLLCHGNFFSSEPQVDLAEKIVSHAFSGKVFFCHSGAEANEAALKLARKAAGLSRHKIISFKNCFHGRTMGALSITPPSFQNGFEPMLEGSIQVPFGDIEALENAIDSQTAGVFIEPIQGEGGINISELSFMKALRALCDKHGILLICDEVWTAPARTGKWFAYQHYGITPDAMTMAKAIGGGAPLAALLVAEKWQDVLSPGTHGCTMGGNPLCAAISLRSLEIIEEDKLCKRAEILGNKIQEFFTQQKLSCIKEVRGKGLMIALELKELKDGISPMDIVKECLTHGLSIAPGKNNTIRLAPALNIKENLLDEGLNLLKDVLINY